MVVIQYRSDRYADLFSRDAFETSMQCISVSVCLFYRKMPSLSPFKRSTLFCSQFSRSRPASFCNTGQQCTTNWSSPCSNNKSIPVQTYIVLLAHVHLARGSPHIELLVLGHLSDLSVVALVPDCRRGREDKGPSNDDGHKGQAKGQKGVFVEE